MAVDPAGFCKVKYVYQDSTGELYPGMEAKLTGSPTTPQLQDLADAMGGFWQDRLAALTDPKLTLQKLRLIYSDGTIEHLVESSVNVVGTTGGTVSIPRSACLVTGYGIGSFYRGGKPRTYWPYIGAYATSSTTHFPTATAAAYATAVQDLIDDINGYTATGVTAFALGCIRRTRLGAPITPPEFWPYLSVHADARICTQRDRLGRL